MSHEPTTVEELNSEYLTGIARKMLGDPTLRVTAFSLTADPFEFPRFGEKSFYLIDFDYNGSAGPGHAAMIVRFRESD